MATEADLFGDSDGENDVEPTAPSAGSSTQNDETEEKDQEVTNRILQKVAGSEPLENVLLLTSLLDPPTADSVKSTLNIIDTMPAEGKSVLIEQLMQLLPPNHLSWIQSNVLKEKAVEPQSTDSLPEDAEAIAAAAGISGNPPPKSSNETEKTEKKERKSRKRHREEGEDGKKSTVLGGKRAIQQFHKLLKENDAIDKYDPTAERDTDGGLMKAIKKKAPGLQDGMTIVASREAGWCNDNKLCANAIGRREKELFDAVSKYSEKNRDVECIEIKNVSYKSLTSKWYAYNKRALEVRVNIANCAHCAHTCTCNQ